MKTNPSTRTTPLSSAIQQLVSEFRSSDYKDRLEEINRHAGITPVSVEPSLYSLIVRSLRLRDLSNGAFDICRANPSVSQKIETNPLELSIYLPEPGMNLAIEGV